MTCWGASRNVGTSGGVNTGGADPGVSSSSCKNGTGQSRVQFRTQYVCSKLQFFDVSRIIYSQTAIQQNHLFTAVCGGILRVVVHKTTE